jgi:hypothetical protein
MRNHKNILYLVCNLDLHRVINTRQVPDQPGGYRQGWGKRRRAAMGRQKHVDLLRRFGVLYVLPSCFPYLTYAFPQTLSNS